MHTVLRITAFKPQYFLTLESQPGPFPKVTFQSERNPTGYNHGTPTESPETEALCGHPNYDLGSHISFRATQT